MQWSRTSWWFQPHWQVLVKLESFPQIGMKIKKYLKTPPREISATWISLPNFCKGQCGSHAGSQHSKPPVLHFDPADLQFPAAFPVWRGGSTSHGPLAYQNQYILELEKMYRFWIWWLEMVIYKHSPSKKVGIIRKEPLINRWPSGFEGDHTSFYGAWKGMDSSTECIYVRNSLLFQVDKPASPISYWKDQNGLNKSLLSFGCWP